MSTRNLLILFLEGRPATLGASVEAGLAPRQPGVRAVLGIRRSPGVASLSCSFDLADADVNDLLHDARRMRWMVMVSTSTISAI